MPRSSTRAKWLIFVVSIVILIISLLISVAYVFKLGFITKEGIFCANSLSFLLARTISAASIAKFTPLVIIIATLIIGYIVYDWYMASKTQKNKIILVTIRTGLFKKPQKITLITKDDALNLLADPSIDIKNKYKFLVTLAIKLQNEEYIRSILSETSQENLLKLLEKKDKKGRDLLLLVAKAGLTKIIKILLESNKITRDSLLVQDANGHIALTINKNHKVAQTFLDNPNILNILTNTISYNNGLVIHDLLQKLEQFIYTKGSNKTQDVWFTKITTIKTAKIREGFIASINKGDVRQIHTILKMYVDLLTPEILVDIVEITTGKVRVSRESQWNLLHLAIIRDNPEIVKALVEFGIQYLAKDKFKVLFTKLNGSKANLFMEICNNNKTEYGEIINIILQHINDTHTIGDILLQQDEFGNNALMLAIDNGVISTVLLNYLADKHKLQHTILTTKNYAGKDILTLAMLKPQYDTLPHRITLLKTLLKTELFTLEMFENSLKRNDNWAPEYANMLNKLTYLCANPKHTITKVMLDQLDEIEHTSSANAA